MSTGLNYLTACIRDGARQALYDIPRELFDEGEVATFDWVAHYVDQYDTMPTWQVLQENNVPYTQATANVDYYADRLRSRKLYNVCRDGLQNIQQGLTANDNAAVMASISELYNGSNNRLIWQDSVTHIDAAFRDVWQDYQRARVTHGMQGTTTGFTCLDGVTGGLKRGDISTIVARPGIGKSFTLAYSALAAWRSGQSVLFVSMEMTAIEMARRMLGMVTGVSAEFLEKGELSQEGEMHVERYISQMGGMPPFILVVGDLEKSIRDIDGLMQTYTPDIVYVDAGYLLSPTAGGMFRGRRHEALEEVNKEMKGLALRRDRHIMQSVQFNRTQKKDEEMDLDQIGGTDEIGRISSLVLGIKLGKAPNERTRRRYSVLKNRGGIDWLNFEINFMFEPFNMDVVWDNQFVPNEGDSTAYDMPQDISWEEA